MESSVTAVDFVNIRVECFLSGTDVYLVNGVGFYLAGEGLRLIQMSNVLNIYIV